MTFPVGLIRNLFEKRAALGRSEEVYLANSRGVFIIKGGTPSAQGRTQPIAVPPLQACLAGERGEGIGWSYRNVAIIDGYRFIPEIGGGCIVAEIDEAVAFASLRRMELCAAAMTILLAAAGIFISIAIGRRIARPITKLTEATRAIIGGNFQARADVSGNNEVTELARAFNLMGEHLLMLIGELGEHNVRLEERVRDRTAELEAANRKLAALSTTDGLTCLANRRHLDDMLESEWRRAIRHGQPIALIMVDVDHFKSFNDLYGHQEGDECLRRIAEVLADHTQRSGELAARYGGEEFTIILPGADSEQASGFAEEVRRAVADLVLPHRSSRSGIVTISLGVASTIPDGSKAVSCLVAEADRALYQAKAAGRNRVAGCPEIVRN